MATFRKTAKGYRAEVFVKGQRDSRCFRVKREAEAWALKRETELRDQEGKLPGERITLRQALRKYAEDVSPTKRGQRWELIRLQSFERHPFLPLDKTLSEIGGGDMADWRDARLKEVSSGSVLREFGLLASIFETCRLEWRWIKTNPLREVRRPKSPPHRDVVITKSQQCKMLRTMGYSSKGRCATVTQAVAICFLVAMRTGMRAGELTSLTWGRVKDDYCELTAEVTKAKTARNVPLTRKTMRLIDRMRGFDSKFVFGIKTASLDAMFRKYRQRAGLSGFTWHDTRHTAATWIGRSGKIELLEFCRMFGWKDPKLALVYFNATASDIAKRFDAKPPSSR